VRQGVQWHRALGLLHYSARHSTLRRSLHLGQSALPSCPLQHSIRRQLRCPGLVVVLHISGVG